jgi:hypothetical protein
VSNDPIRNLAKSASKAAGFDQSQRKHGNCISCRMPARPRCYSQAGLNEYAISGMCEICFDELFAEPDEEGGTDERSNG